MATLHPQTRPAALSLACRCMALGLGLLLVGLAATASQPDPTAGHCLTQRTDDSTAPKYRRAVADYPLPEVSLTRMDGVRMPVAEVLAADRPVMLNFIFTSCSTICPVLSATFAQVDRLLGAEASQVSFISVSIDPEQDTRTVLQRYAQTYAAGDNWQFYTGTRPDIVTLQRAFDTYRGNKMSHQPVTFLPSRADAPWLRIDGFPKAEDLVREYRALIQTPSPG